MRFPKRLPPANMLLALCLASPLFAPQCPLTTATSPNSPIQAIGHLIDHDGVHMLAVESKAGVADSVMAYQLDASTGAWTFAQEVILPGSASGSITRLHIDGDDAVVHQLSGAVIALARDPAGGSWQVLGEVTATTFGGLFPHGNRLALHDGVLLVGQPATRSVDVWERSAAATGWTLTESLMAPGSTTTTFGDALAFDGRSAVIGDKGAVLTRGAAHVWTRTALGSWQFNATLRAPAFTFTGVGSSVAVEGDVILLGAERTTQASGGIGALLSYRYVPSTGVFLLVQSLDSPVQAPDFMVGGEFEFKEGYLVARVQPLTAGIASQLWTYRFDRINGLFAFEDAIDAPHPGPVLSLGLANTISLSEGRLVYTDSSTQGISSTPVSERDCDQNGTGDACEILMGSVVDVNGNWQLDACEETGVRYCSPAVPNSTGRPARMGYFGEPRVALLFTQLCASDLPPGLPGYFLASRGSQSVVNPGGAVGTLCLEGAPIARAYGGRLMSDPSGRVSTTLNRALIPGQTANSVVPILPGDTWNFQYWYRDIIGTQRVSNFTDAVSVTFTLF